MVTNNARCLPFLPTASSPTITYPCVATRCSDGTTFDLTEDIESQANPRLVDDDDVIDGHRTCMVTLAPSKGSICLFNFTRENTMLVVRDNEGEIAGLRKIVYCGHKLH